MMKNLEFICLVLIVGLFVISVKSQTENTGITRTSKKKSNTSAPKKTKPKSVSKPTSNKTESAKSPTKTKRRQTSAKTRADVTAELEITVRETGSRVEIVQIDNGVEKRIRSYTIGESNKTVTLESLEAGDYIVKVRKSGYFDEDKNFTLRAGRTANVEINLKPSVGYLTIRSDTDGTETEIKGVGSISGRVENLILPPQKYEVLITKDGYEPLTQIADVRLGQTTLISANLTPISSEKLLQIAENDFRAENYKNVIKTSRLILERDTDNIRANMLTGYSYFYTNRPRESRFYFLKVLAKQAGIEIPIKIYQKVKGSEILTEGVLKMNHNDIAFISANKPDLNFTVSPASIIKLEINQDKNNSNRPDSIEIKAEIRNGRKTSKRTVELFSRQAFARVVARNKSEIAVCTGCGLGNCCSTEIQAVYELLLNWKSGSYSQPTSPFVDVASPSSSYIEFQNQQFSLSVPNNWQITSQTETEMWIAPSGGFYRKQNTVYYGYAVNAGISEASNNDLRAASDSFYATLLASNSYLEPQNPPREVSISGRKVLVLTLIGFDVNSGDEDFVQIYTAFAPDGKLFHLITVVPYEKRLDYQTISRRILETVRFR